MFVWRRTQKNKRRTVTEIQVRPIGQPRSGYITIEYRRGNSLRLIRDRVKVENIHETERYQQENVSQGSL